VEEVNRTRVEAPALPGTPHVFVSYRSLERSFAIKLAGALIADGVAAWADRLPDGIKPADEWPETLERAIDNCRAFLAVVSPEYVKSKVCLQELRRASRLGKQIFPVLLRDIGAKEDWPLELEGIQFVDFTGWQATEDFAGALDSLIDRLRDGDRPLVGQQPDPEQRYLIKLISDLESEAYLTLAAELRSSRHDEELDAETDLLTEWGLGAEFTLFEKRRADVLQSEQGVQIADAMQLLDEARRFVILGEPGAGKSTTLRRLAVEAARKRLSNPRKNPLPLLLDLRNWQDEPSHVDFLKSGWPFESPLDTALAADEVTLFLDGLNEMGRHTPTNVAKLKHWLERSRTPGQIAIACRVHDYANLDLGLDKLTIQPLDRERLERFTQLYLKDRSAAFLNAVLNSEGRTEDPRDYAQLVRNPYLCQCLMYVFRKAPGGRLPRNFGTLFRQLAEVLWTRELERRTQGWIPFRQAEERFGQLAYTMIDENTAVMSPELLLGASIGEDLVHAGVSASILAERGGSIHFYHQLMQESFAAVQVLRGPPVEELARNEKWREVLAAAAGLARDPSDFVAHVLESDAVTAAHCVAFASDIRDDVVDRVVERLSLPLTELIRLENSFAEHMRTNQFSSWGSIEMANDAMENAVDRLYEEIDPRIVPALREMNAAAIASLKRIGARDVLEFLTDVRPHKTEGHHLTPGAFKSDV
jgi:hypothetical protein